jgi:hypothetical protein
MRQSLMLVSDDGQMPLALIYLRLSGGMDATARVHRCGISNNNATSQFKTAQSAQPKPRDREQSIKRQKPLRALFVCCCDALASRRSCGRTADKPTRPCYCVAASNP